MTGFIEELSEVIRRVIIRPASIDPPQRIGSGRGSRTRTLRRHPLRPNAPPSYVGLALLPRGVLVPTIVRDQKTKAAKRK